MQEDRRRLRSFFARCVMHFTLYSRSYCHLCDDMLQALRAFDVDNAFMIDVVDIDADPDSDLLARYDELVPVLLGRKEDGQLMQLCHYFFDETAVRAFLDGGKSPFANR